MGIENIFRNLNDKMDRREFIRGSSSLAFFAALYRILPKETYASETGGLPVYEETKVNNFRELQQQIESDEVVCVMYTTSDSRMPEKYRIRGQNFWNVLKDTYGVDVDIFVKADCKGWYDKASKEIGENTYPSFLIYEGGKVINENTGRDLRILGAPKKGEDLKNQIEYIENNWKRR